MFGLISLFFFNLASILENSIIILVNFISVKVVNEFAQVLGFYFKRVHFFFVG